MNKQPKQETMKIIMNQVNAHTVIYNRKPSVNNQKGIIYPLSDGDKMLFSHKVEPRPLIQPDY